MDQFYELLHRGVAEIVVESEFRKRLASGKSLRLKQGFDPTKPDMHIGHAVGLRKLRAFQEHGHQVVLIVGDWTAQIGDPSDRDSARPRLDAATVRANAELFMEQFFRVVDRQKTEIRYQSEWFGTFDLEKALELTGRFTVAQMLAHETFRKRYESGQPLTILELMYPMLQGYDSVVVNSDVEFGGTDQKFNNLAGRDLMAQLGMVPQDILLVPLIPGTDGRKMSKSYDNTVDIRMEPFEKYSKILSMGDDVLPLYFEVLSDVPQPEIDEMRAALAAGGVNPMEFKMRLAREVVTLFDSAAAASASEAEWIRRFRDRELPREIPAHVIGAPTNIIDLMLAAGLAASKGEARRLIDGGGVRVAGEKIGGYDLLLDPATPVVVQVGRRKFVRVVGA